MTNKTQARVDRLEELFTAIFRNQPTHPQHGLFVGLVTEGPKPLPVVINAEDDQ